MTYPQQVKKLRLYIVTKLPLSVYISELMSFVQDFMVLDWHLVSHGLFLVSHVFLFATLTSAARLGVSPPNIPMTLSCCLHVVRHIPTWRIIRKTIVSVFFKKTSQWLQVHPKSPGFSWGSPTLVWMVAINPSWKRWEKRPIILSVSSIGAGFRKPSTVALDFKHGGFLK